MIDLSCDLFEIFDNARLFPIRFNTSIESWLKSFIFNIFFSRCLIMKDSLHLPQHLNRTFLEMIGFKCDLLTMFNDETFSPSHLNIETEVWLEWLIFSAIYSGCSTMNHYLRLISILQQASHRNDWFQMWFVRDVRWWSICFNWPQYSNKTLLRMIDISYDSFAMFGDERFSSSQLNTPTDLWWEWLICHVIYLRCSVMKDSLQLNSILQQNFSENDWFVMWFICDVRWWKILFSSTQYCNRTLVRMIDFLCDLL